MVRGLNKGTSRSGKSLARVIGGWLFFILCIVGILLLIIGFVGQKTTVSGTSMYPTLLDGDVLIVDKITYRFTDPRRFDVIVFPYQFDEEIYYIKRIIGLPGETVQISNGRIYINGELLEEPYEFDEIRQAGVASNPVTLEDDEYFVLGDNRNDSSDSRVPAVGNIKRSEIEGRALLRVWPLESFGLVG